MATTPPTDQPNFVQVYWPNIRQAIQTTVAAVGAYLLASWLTLPQGYWAVMTAILVVQASVGASLGLAIDRLLATLLGAAVGGALVTIFGISHATIAPLLAVSVAALSLFATLRPSLRLAPVTAAIVILGDAHYGSPLSSAFNRVIEIGVGATMAIAVSLVVFPSRAGASLSDQVGRTLPLFAEHLRGTFDVAMGGGTRTDEDVVAINGKVRAGLISAGVLVREAQREIAGHIADHADPAAVLRTLRRLWHTQLMAGRAALTPLPTEVVAALASSLEGVRDDVSWTIEQLGAAYRGEASVPDTDRVERSLAALNAAIVELRRSGIMLDMSTEQVAQVFSFTFALGQLGQNLKDLADRHDDLHGNGPARSTDRPDVA